MQPDHYWTNDAGASMEFSFEGSQVRSYCSLCAEVRSYLVLCQMREHAQARRQGCQ